MSDNEKLMEAALRLLDFQDRTSAELREKLIKKGFDPEDVSRAVAHLEDSGVLDDKRYAEIFTMSKYSSGKGRSWIKQKLSLKGIDRELIEHALSAAAEEVDERILCIEKALSICLLSDRYEVTSDGEIVPVCFGFDDMSDEYAENDESAGNTSERESVRYFYRKIAADETDKNIIYKEHEKAKASLTRRLISAGYPPGYAFEAVRKIDKL